MKVVLKNLRLAFPALHEASSVDDGDERFGGKFIMEPKSPNVKIIKEAIKAVAFEKWEKKAETIRAQLEKKDKLCFKTEPYAKKDGTVYDGFEGMYYVNASNEARPTLKDRDGKTPLVSADGKPYGGCYVNAVLDVWAQDNKFGQRINATLLGVQFVRDGDHFAGGATISDDDFEDLGVDEDTDEVEADDEGADDLA